MNRRDFSTTVAGIGLVGSGLALPVHAQGKPVEGKDYVRLAQPQPVPAGKIEVIEFFWYGCPHCNAFEPMIEAWSKKLPPDVSFRRVPVAFREEPFVAHQKIFYTLEALEQLDALHRKVFYAIHVERQRLDKLADIAAFVAKHGVDAGQVHRDVQLVFDPDQGRPGAQAGRGVPHRRRARRWACMGAISPPERWPARRSARWR